MRLEVAEFFAGAGMFLQGLDPARWTGGFANDIDPMKAAVHRANHPGVRFMEGDVTKLTSEDLPDRLVLAHASSPCQDLSLAGQGRGLAGERSGTFHAWRRLMAETRRRDRGPALVTFENVVGILTSHGGEDFRLVVQAFVEMDLLVGPMILDAVWWLPQSRPRLVIIAVDRRLAGQARALASPAPNPFCHPPRLVRAVERLPEPLRQAILWWNLPAPCPRNVQLVDLVEDDPVDVAWRPEAEVERIVSLMSAPNRVKLATALKAGGRAVGTLYRRTRPTPDGGKTQRAEVRFDGVAGCLRVPSGGSSRQTLVVIEDGRVRMRLLSGREAARLMGLPDTFALPPTLNDALAVAGDGIAIPVVRHLADHVLDPLAEAAARLERAVAC